MSEIKPCPFCEQTPNTPIKVSLSKLWANWRLFHVCKKTDDTQVSMSIDVTGSTKEQCINYWNRRVSHE